MKFSNDKEEMEAHVGRLPEGAIPLYVVSTVVYVDTQGQRRYNMRVVAPDDAYPQVTDVVGTCAIAQWLAADDLSTSENEGD